VSGGLWGTGLESMSAIVPTEEVACGVCGSRTCRVTGAAVDFEYRTCDNVFSYVTCGDCGHVYLRNRPLPGALSTIYPPGYGNYDASRGDSLPFRVKQRLDERKLRGVAELCPHVRRVLDVGCADGRLLDLCRRLFPGADLRGLEISEHAARAARKKGYEITIGTVDDAVLPADTFDLVFLQQVIEHVFFPDRVCEAVARSLAPGGLVVFETPTVDAADYRLFRNRYWGGYHVPRHFHLFSARSLSRLCRAAGLDVVRVRYGPQPIHWVWTLHHFLEDRGAPQWATAGLHIRNALAMAAGTLAEFVAALLTGKMSNLEVVARRPVAPSDGAPRSASSHNA
jgi:SAM-dependent methyltransferase